MYRRSALAILAVLTSMAALLAAGCQQAENYPNRPIEYVVHTAAGSGTDLLARLVSDILTNKQKLVSQSITVVNKEGGSGTVSMAYVAEKKGDPYVIYNVSNSFVTGPLQAGSPITYKDFTPVANLVRDANVIVVSADSPYKTLKDLTDAGKSGKKMTQAGGSVTSLENMLGFLLKKSSGAQWEFVSYGGGGASTTTALLGGNGDFAIPSPAEVAELVRAGKIRVLATNTEKRLDIWPDVPTLKELNVPYVSGSFRGAVMPKDVPPDTVKFWETALQKVAGTEEWKKYIKDNSMEDAWMSGQQFGTYLSGYADSLTSLMSEMGLLKK